MALEDLVLGKVLGVEAVADRQRMEPVVVGQLDQLLGGGVHHVEPHESGLGLFHYGAYGHRRQMRLAAAAAPKPLSILTTVTPAAQELSMPSRAASPPNDAP
jgi:hypothetical protein